MMTTLPPALERNLGHGERVLWTGRPAPKYGIVPLIVGVVFAGAFLVWEVTQIYGAMRDGTLFESLQRLLLYLGIIPVMVAGEIVYYSMTRSTLHVLTDRRAVKYYELGPFFPKVVTSTRLSVGTIVRQVSESKELGSLVIEGGQGSVVSRSMTAGANVYEQTKLRFDRLLDAQHASQIANWVIQNAWGAVATGTA